MTVLRLGTLHAVLRQSFKPAIEHAPYGFLTAFGPAQRASFVLTAAAHGGTLS
jgi:hypothetical protein